MMNSAPIAAGPELRDIHLPPPPSWWPPAPGWWIAALLLIVVLGVSLWVLIRVWRRRRWRQRVKAELARIAANYTAQPDAVRATAEISHLLRRATLLIDRHAVALSGEHWLNFLDRQFKEQGFSQGPGRVLIDAPFRPTAEIDVVALLALVRRWLDHVFKRGPHRV